MDQNNSAIPPLFYTLFGFDCIAVLCPTVAVALHAYMFRLFRAYSCSWPVIAIFRAIHPSDKVQAAWWASMSITHRHLKHFQKIDAWHVLNCCIDRMFSRTGDVVWRRTTRIADRWCNTGDLVVGWLAFLLGRWLTTYRRKWLIHTRLCTRDKGDELVDFTKHTFLFGEKSEGLTVSRLLLD